MSNPYDFEYDKDNAMSTPNDGGPALPRPLGEALGTVSDSFVGMSMRDWFAGQALPALLGYWLNQENEESPITVATEEAYAVADNMIKERAKSNP